MWSRNFSEQMPMLDAKGRPIAVGASVVTGGMLGRVVCSIDTGAFTSAYSKEHWGYLKSGVMVETAEAGLLHVDNPSQIELENSY
jgi:hypothetical protein